MKKLYYIDRLETKLCKAEIEERLRDIVLEDKFFNIFTKGKKLYHAESKENIYSFSYLKSGRSDMLIPRIHMTVLEKSEGCICDLYYSKTWGFLYLFIFWNIYVGGLVYDSVLRSNVFRLICSIVVYILVIWMAQKHCNSICKKVVNILKEQFSMKIYGGDCASSQLDDLLKISEYDIYNNPNVSDEGIKKIADIISADKSIDLKEYFDLLKCSSKFCWLNYLKILEKLPKEDRIRGLPILFELLQDSNWPTFQKTMELFEKIDKEAINTIPSVIELSLHRYLTQAYAEDDEMWIENMQLLAKNLNISC